MRRGQRWKKRHGKEGGSPPGDPGKAVKLTGCGERPITGYNLDNLGLHYPALFIRKTEFF